MVWLIIGIVVTICASIAVAPVVAWWLMARITWAAQGRVANELGLRKVHGAFTGDVDGMTVRILTRRLEVHGLPGAVKMERLTVHQTEGVSDPFLRRFRVHGPIASELQGRVMALLNTPGDAVDSGIMTVYRAEVPSAAEVREAVALAKALSA